MQTCTLIKEKCSSRCLKARDQGSLYQLRPAQVWCIQWHLPKPDRLLATAPDRSFALYTALRL